MLRLVLLRHGPTASTASATFGDDGELTQRGFQQAASLDLPRAHRAARSPALVAAATARAVELDAEADPGLADWDPGRWRGRTLDDLTAADPEAVHAWLTDPAAAPHGGESLLDVLGRTQAWLARVAGPTPQTTAVDRAELLVPADGTLVAITHAAIVRAAVVSVLAAPPAAFWALDVAPLSVTELRHRDGRWHLRAFNR